MRVASSDGTEPPPPADTSARRPYMLRHHLLELWRDEVSPRLLPDEAAPEAILNDALDLLGNQGDAWHP